MMCLNMICQALDCDQKDCIQQCTCVVVACTTGCMVGQVNQELGARKHATTDAPLAKGLNGPKVAYGTVVDEGAGAPLIAKDMKR